MSLNRTFAAALLCASLAACASDPANPARTAVNPADLYPLQAALTPDRVALALHADGLSPAQAQALTAFAGRWRQDGEDMIRLEAPRGGPNMALAVRGQAEAMSLLVRHGVPSASIQLSLYDSTDPKAPLLVSFTRYVAKAPACGLEWDSLTNTEDNNVQSNFGCAVSANMAAQIAHPADIVHPRAEDAPDAERREVVMDKYAQGKATGADHEANGSTLSLKSDH
jgi:pilus assembly protein CpaD